MMKSLLDQAKEPEHKIKKVELKYTKEDIELVMAWIRDEIKLGSIMRVKKIKSGAGVYCYLSIVCKMILRKQ